MNPPMTDGFKKSPCQIGLRFPFCSLYPVLIINPIWTGLFANLKRIGEGGGGGRGKNDPPPNLAIPGQITKGYTMRRNIYKLQKFLMTPLSC